MTPVRHIGVYKSPDYNQTDVPISFDLFGTLVEIDRPDDPAALIAEQLAERSVSVPDDFGLLYREHHIDAPEGAEIPLPAHVGAALSSRGIEPGNSAVRRAIVAAFDQDVSRAPGAKAAIEAAREAGVVGLCSNCAVPELVKRTLIRADLHGEFDAVVTSLACGWRKPDERIFDHVATALDCDTTGLIHVGDQPATDGGIEAAGGEFIDITESPLTELPAIVGS